MMAMVGKIIKTCALVMIIFTFITAIEPSSVSSKEKINSFRIISFEWTIENLHFNEFVKNQPLDSITFFDGWYLSFFPKGQTKANNEYVSLYLVSIPGNRSANIRLAFMNAKDEEINPLETNYYFDIKGGGWGYPNFTSIDFVTNANNGLFINNRLRIFCEIKTKLPTSQDVLKKIEPLPLDDNLGTDLAVLLDNELFSDVIISSGGKNFSAHKAVLAARCPLFKDMFQNDIQVRNTSWFNMTDVDSEVMDEMLRYIYTGKVSNLEDLAPILLPAAERCQWVRLKRLCARSILSKLSIVNAVEYYKLGEINSAVYLKDQARYFIIAHASDIVSTNEFKSLMLTHPLLVQEILSSLAKNVPSN